MGSQGRATLPTYNRYSKSHEFRFGPNATCPGCYRSQATYGGKIVAHPHPFGEGICVGTGTRVPA